MTLLFICKLVLYKCWLNYIIGLLSTYKTKNHLGALVNLFFGPAILFWGISVGVRDYAFLTVPRWTSCRRSRDYILRHLYSLVRVPFLLGGCFQSYLRIGAASYVSRLAPKSRKRLLSEWQNYGWMNKLKVPSQLCYHTSSSSSYY